MNNNNKIVLNYYDKLNKSEYENYKKVGWGSLESQTQRFKILTQIGLINKKSILDVGCGVGDLYGWLLKNNYTLTYEGLDINPNLIESAKKKYPDISFSCSDFLCESFIKTYDYALLSGALTVPQNNQSELIFKVIEKMFLLSKYGVALNFLSVFSDYFEPNLYYADPSEIIRMSSSISKKFILRHDYMTHDMTIFIYH